MKKKGMGNGKEEKGGGLITRNIRGTKGPCRNWVNKERRQRGDKRHRKSKKRGGRPFGLTSQKTEKAMKTGRSAAQKNGPGGS